MRDPMRRGIADLVITATASQLVLEAALAAEGPSYLLGSDSGAMRASLADAVADERPRALVTLQQRGLTP